MVNFNNLFFVLFLAVCFSCKSQTAIIENELKDCINQNLNVKNFKINKSVDFNFYEMISKFESFFISNKFITEEKSKEDYDRFIENVKKDSFSLSDINENILVIKKESNYNGSVIDNIVLQGCPHLVIEKTKEENTMLSKQVEIMDKLVAFDPYDLAFIAELGYSVSANDFESIVYRAPLILTLLNYIDYKVNYNNKD